MTSSIPVPDAVPPEERKGARTRAAILTTAAHSFRAEGYDAATLSGIAAHLGITRSAVLHHFSTKQAILHELVAPFIAALDELLDRAGPFTVHSRRRLIVEMVDLLAANRSVAALLTRDVTVHAHLPADLQILDRASRFVSITTQANDDHPLAATRSLAALGSVLRPVTAADDIVDLDDPFARALLVTCALAVLRVPLPDVDPGA